MKYPTRRAIAIFALLTASFGISAADSFSEQMSGIYSPTESGLSVKILLVAEDDGFSGSIEIGGQSFEVYAVREGLDVSGVYQDGNTPRFFQIPFSSQATIDVTFPDDNMTITMSREALPAFAGIYRWPGGRIELRDSDGSWWAHTVLSTGDVKASSGSLSALSISFAESSITWSTRDNQYYLETADYFGAADFEAIDLAGIERQALDAAISENTEQAYNRFISDHPLSPLVADADSRIADLWAARDQARLAERQRRTAAEEAAFNSAGTAEDFENFISQYSNSSRVVEAQRKMSYLQAKEYSEEHPYLGYMNSPYVNEGKNGWEQLADFIKSSPDSPEAIAAYDLIASQLQAALIKGEPYDPADLIEIYRIDNPGTLGPLLDYASLDLSEDPNRSSHIEMASRFFSEWSVTAAGRFADEFSEILDTMDLEGQTWERVSNERTLAELWDIDNPDRLAQFLAECTPECGGDIPAYHSAWNSEIRFYEATDLNRWQTFYGLVNGDRCNRDHSICGVSDTDTGTPLSKYWQAYLLLTDPGRLIIDYQDSPYLDLAEERVSPNILDKLRKLVAQLDSPENEVDASLLNNDVFSKLNVSYLDFESLKLTVKAEDLCHPRLGEIAKGEGLPTLNMLCPDAHGVAVHRILPEVEQQLALDRERIDEVVEIHKSRDHRRMLRRLRRTERLETEDRALLRRALDRCIPYARGARLLGKSSLSYTSTPDMWEFYSTALEAAVKGGSKDGDINIRLTACLAGFDDLPVEEVERTSALVSQLADGDNLQEYFPGYYLEYQYSRAAHWD